MCGIIGYIGERDATPILIKGIERLEYRGYDSSGIAVLHNGKIHLRKTKGKIKDLLSLLKSRPLPNCTVGISHTRWATHGKPSEINAHPHLDCRHRIAVVHNGIIENYQAIKSRLKKAGHKFISETDTEVVVHLIEQNYKGNLEEAVIKSVKEIKGSYALGVISLDEPERLVACRLGSPLIIGIGKNENFIASDVPAILDRTRKVIYLEDGQVAALVADKILIFNLKGKKVSYKVDTVKFDLSSAQKENFPHFMLKEIFEQPKVLRQMLVSHLKGTQQIKLAGINLSSAYLKAVDNIIIIACGTAYHAGLVGKYIIEDLTRVPVWVDLSSEFRYRKPILKKHTLVIAISQSGETADTLAAVKEVKKQGLKILSICNVVGSSLTRESAAVFYTHAGPEIGVASTKAYTAQLTALYLLALYLSQIKQTISRKRFKEIILSLKNIPRLQEGILKENKKIMRIADNHSNFGCFLYLGRNINFPSALEGALKLKEISYIPAEGYAAGEMKHGPIALIDEYRAVVCIAPDCEIYEKMISNIQEIRARRGKVIVLATEGNSHIKDFADEIIYLPKTHEFLTPLIIALPLQLLAYYIAVKRGCDVDQPRNLAKSVTVE